MNTSSCCGQCSWQRKEGVTESCDNPSCPCHQPQEWEKEFDAAFDWIEEEKERCEIMYGFTSEKLKAFIASLIANTETRCAQISAKLIQDAKEKSYEEGRTGGIQDAGYMQGEEYAKGYEEGRKYEYDLAQQFMYSEDEIIEAEYEARAALIAELLAAWPKETHLQTVPMTLNEHHVQAYNNALRTTRAIIESKRTTK